MERYKSNKVGESYVYSYDMPKEIYIKESNQIKVKKRRLRMPFKKLIKTREIENKIKSNKIEKESKLNSKISDLSSNNNNNINQSKTIKLKNSLTKSSMNCCKIS